MIRSKKKKNYIELISNWTTRKVISRKFNSETLDNLENDFISGL